MMHRHLLWAAFAATLGLAACGGSDDSPAPTPAPSPAPVPSGDRIEPLDTANLPRSEPVKAMTAAVSRLPAGASVARVALGPLVANKRAASPDKGAALQIGTGREIGATTAPADTARQWRWQRLADSSQVAAISFAAEGAQALRLGVLAQELPAGTVLRFYGAAGDKVVEMPAAELAALRLTNEAAGLSGDAARMVWGPDTAGAQSTLEVQLPAGATPGQLRLAVPQLSHLTQTVAQASDGIGKNTAQIGDSGSCNVDIMCGSYQTEGRSVAKMVFTKGGSTYLCTGTLLNDTRNSQTPYFLSAAHCIADQAAASTLLTYWFFRAEACNSSPKFDPNAVRLSGGAQLLYTRAAVDTTLLRLNAAPPANVVYAGSYFGAGVVAGTDVLGVHHPSGDLQKMSIGSVRGFVSCSGFNSGGTTNCASANRDTGTMFSVLWRQGTTEGGSSGSAIFAQTGNTRYVVGALSSGSASCANPSGTDSYGRFELSFADGIKDWLTR